MEVLLTGNTMFLTKEWIEEAFPDDHVLTTHRKDDMLSDTRIKSVILDGRQLLEQLQTTYDFDRVVYFSEYGVVCLQVILPVWFFSVLSPYQIFQCIPS